MLTRQFRVCAIALTLLFAGSATSQAADVAGSWVFTFPTDPTPWTITQSSPETFEAVATLPTRQSLSVSGGAAVGPVLFGSASGFYNRTPFAGFMIGIAQEPTTPSAQAAETMQGAFINILTFQYERFEGARAP